MRTENRKMVYEVLKSLCCDNGWSYGVFWSFDQQNSMLLTMEEAYYEDLMGVYIENMLLQVHMLGNGIVGHAAFTKGHQWIFRENYLRDTDSLGYVGHHEVSQDECEIHSQFSSGIETIAIIYVEPLGVVQFGSTLKILEMIQFVDQVKKHFREIEDYDIFSSLFSNPAMNSFSGDIASSYNYTSPNCLSTDIQNVNPFNLENGAKTSSHIENQLQMPYLESPSLQLSDFSISSPEFLIDFPSTCMPQSVVNNEMFDNLEFDFDFGEIENIFDDVSIPEVSVLTSGTVPEKNVNFEFAPKESLFSTLGIENSFTFSSSENKLFPGIKRKREICSDSQSCENSYVSQAKKSEESVKIVKKRAKPGSRPKPKDRQQIQDRISELRKLIPNGLKMSIDSLLAQTIKHMFYLESVTKHAENIKKAEARKDNDYMATWVYESQDKSMLDPIVVKDLSIPGQKQIQMLCEEKGFFLEIVDVIQSFGLNILKGVIEVRENKIWACFIVDSEGKKYVTKQEIYLSLHQLLSQQSSSENKMCDQLAINRSSLYNFHQHIFQLPIEFSDGIL